MAINRTHNRKNNINLLTQFYSGKVGKAFVLKVRNDDSLITKFPDRSGVVLSVSQQKLNSIFSEAVAYAKALIRDPERCEELRQQLKSNKKTAHRSPYHAAIQQFMKDNAPAARLQSARQILDHVTCRLFH